MPGQSHVRLLYHLITTHNLDARYPELARIKRVIELNLLSGDVARAYLLRIEPLVRAARDFPNPLMRPPSIEELYPNGPPDLPFGHLIDDPTVRVGLRCHDRPRAVLVAGNAGSGKTTAIINFVLRLIALLTVNPADQIALVILDRKLDYVHLAERIGPQCTLLSVHDPQTRIGLNGPEGVPPNAWINHLASLLCSRSGMIAAWTPLASMMRWLLAVLNPAPGPAPRWPSLRLMLQVAKASPPGLWGSKVQYEDTLIGVLEAATQSTHLFDCFSGLNADDLIRSGRHLILAMPNFEPTWLRRFTMDLILTQILQGRIQRQHKVDRTEVVEILDEADQDVTVEADAQFADRMPPLSQTLRMGREFGIMPITGVAKLHDISPFVLCEPPYHLIFTQSDARSILEACRTLALSGAEPMFPALQPGECIFREAQGPWPHPMLVKVDYVPPGRGPLTRPYDALPYIPCLDLNDMPDVQEALNRRIAEYRQTQVRQTFQKGRSTTLSDNEHALLHAAAVHHSSWLPVVRLWEKAGLKPAPQAQIDARKKLENKKLAKFQELRIGRVNVLMMRLTEAGWRSVNREAPRDRGRGGIAHQHIAHWLERIGQKRGYEAQIEWVAPGSTHPVDVVWRLNGQWHVFEIIVDSESNLESHIKACFVDSSAVASLTILVAQKLIRAQMEGELRANPHVAPFLDRIRFEVVETYIKELGHE